MKSIFPVHAHPCFCRFSQVKIVVRSHCRQYCSDFCSGNKKKSLINYDSPDGLVILAMTCQEAFLPVPVEWVSVFLLPCLSKVGMLHVVSKAMQSAAQLRHVSHTLYIFCTIII